MARVPLKTGNNYVYLGLCLFGMFVLGWISHEVTFPNFCFPVV